MSRERAIRKLKLAQLIEQALTADQLPEKDIDDQVVKRLADLITAAPRGGRTRRT
ncbi:hypothetical protein [Actinoplanes sp. NPDC051859]|uniref:hypothetical protein n=1 Tax=Actinoplanes sp. NPDC051859 TaxID=3363909 RepID=UPI0037ABF074